jgi:SAM-dependent methyltransferase
MVSTKARILDRETPTEGLQPGSRHYRAFVGPPETYDVTSAIQFNLLTALGLREHHSLLDVGCGSLRAGRLFIPYLLPGRYFGIEPEEWLLEEGLSSEVGKELQEAKRPVFSNDSNFSLSSFGRRFDFILAQSIFSHAGEAQIRRCLAEAKKVMDPDSIFVATFVRGEKDHTGDKWVYPGCTRYTLEKMESLALEQGLACTPFDWPHPAQQTWLLITDPANEKRLPDVGEVARIMLLEQELQLSEQRLARIEGHPYVRFGLTINQLLQPIGRLREWAFNRRQPSS